MTGAAERIGKCLESLDPLGHAYFIAKLFESVLITHEFIDPVLADGLTEDLII